MSAILSVKYCQLAKEISYLLVIRRFKPDSSKVPPAPQKPVLNVKNRLFEFNDTTPQMNLKNRALYKGN